VSKLRSRFQKTKTAFRKRNRASYPLQRLLQYSRKYRSSIWLATICSILNKIFDLAPPALIGIAVDVVVKQQDSIIARWGVKDVFTHF
jgi:ATP-binding cassette subfamily B protein